MLGNREYTKAMGFQLLYWEHLRAINHPILQALHESPANFVGEDIEISLMLTSNYTSTTPLTRKTADVSGAYRKLALLSQIARKVRNYKVSQFGGETQSRAHLEYNHLTPETKATLAFVRKWIAETEEKGLHCYDTKAKIPEKYTARKHSHFKHNVDPIDLKWEGVARHLVSRHLDAFVSESWKSSKSFDKRYMKRFVDLYSFDDAAMTKFAQDSDTDSSADELPLASEEWQGLMAERRGDNSEEAKERERKSRDEKRESRRQAAAAPQPEVKRKPGRPKGSKKTLPAPDPQPAPQPSLAPIKRGRGRPKGSLNKKRKGTPPLGAQTERRTSHSILSSLTYSAVFTADADDDNRFALVLF